MPPTILVGRGSSSHVAITVTRREFPDATSYWDGNWVYATVRVSGGAFGGEYEALLRTDEFAVLPQGARSPVRGCRGHGGVRVDGGVANDAH